MISAEVPHWTPFSVGRAQRRGNPEQKVNEMSKNSSYDYFFTLSMWRIPENVPCSCAHSMKFNQFFCILFPFEKLGIKLSDACFCILWSFLSITSFFFYNHYTQAKECLWRCVWTHEIHLNVVLFIFLLVCQHPQQTHCILTSCRVWLYIFPFRCTWDRSSRSAE